MAVRNDGAQGDAVYSVSSEIAVAGQNVVSFLHRLWETVAHFL